MVHLRIVAPGEQAHAALALLEESGSVINVIHLRTRPTEPSARRQARPPTPCSGRR